MLAHRVSPLTGQPWSVPGMLDADASPGLAAISKYKSLSCLKDYGDFLSRA